MSYTVGYCSHCIRKKEKDGKKEKPLHSSTLPTVGNLALEQQLKVVSIATWTSAADWAPRTLHLEIYPHWKEKAEITLLYSNTIKNIPIFFSNIIHQSSHRWYLSIATLSLHWSCVVYITNRSWMLINTALTLQHTEYLYETVKSSLAH